MKIFKYLFLIVICFIISCCAQKSNKEDKKISTIDTINIIKKDTVKKIQYEIQDTISNEQPLAGNVDPSYKKIKKIKSSDLIYYKPLPIQNTHPNQTIMMNQIQIDSGRLNYIIEDTMEVGKKYIIEVSISKNLTKNEVVSKVITFKGKENSIVDTVIRITNNMEIKIIDPSGESFKIIPLSSEVQVLENKDVTIWKWSVIPLVDGENDLSVVVDVIIGETHKSYTIYDGKIHVYMKNKWFTKTMEWIENNVELVFGSVLIPLIIWLFTTYILPLFKKKKKDE